MEDREKMKLLRRRFSRVGWALLLYVAAAQVLGALALLPSVLMPDLLADWSLFNLAAGEVVIYLLAPIVLWLVLRPLPKAPAEGVPLSVKAWGRLLILSMGLLFFFAIATNCLIVLLQLFTGLSTGDVLQSAADAIPFPLYLVLVGAVAPVMEELIFRRLLLDRLRPFGDAAAILGSGLAFGLFHTNLYQFFYAAALGILFAAVVVKTGRLRHSIALHAAVNLLSTLLSELAVRGAAGFWCYLYVVLCCLGLSVVILLRYLPSYRCSPPRYPVTARQTARAAFTSPGALTCLILLSLASAAVIFFV